MRAGEKTPQGIAESLLIIATYPSGAVCRISRITEKLTALCAMREGWPSRAFPEYLTQEIACRSLIHTIRAGEPLTVKEMEAARLRARRPFSIFTSTAVFYRVAVASSAVAPK